MKKLVFGVEHYNKPTPDNIKKVYKVVLLVSTIWVMVMEPRLPSLSEHVRYIVDSSLAVAGGVLYHLLNFFGVTDVQPANVVPLPTAAAPVQLQYQAPAPQAPQMQEPAPAPMPPSEPPTLPLATDRLGMSAPNAPTPPPTDPVPAPVEPVLPPVPQPVEAPIVNESTTDTHE